MFGAVIIGLEIDRALVQIGEQGLGGLVHAHFGITHCCGHIAVNRAEIALTIDQDQPHGEGLRHADHGVINGRVPVRVILTDHIPDDARRFAIGPAGPIALFMHGKQDAPVHGLEAVTGIGQGPADNDAHRIIEIRAL